MYVEDIKELAKANTDYRRVLYTGKYSQIVTMCIPVGEDIGEQVHPSVDQILIVIDGEGEAILNGQTQKVKEHDLIFVPAGVTHNIRNTDDEELRLFTAYAPPEHPDGTVHRTKEEANQEEYE